MSDSNDNWPRSRWGKPKWEERKGKSKTSNCHFHLADVRWLLWFLFSRSLARTEGNHDALESCRCHLLTERFPRQEKNECYYEKSRPHSQATINTSYNFSNVLGGWVTTIIKSSIHTTSLNICQQKLSSDEKCEDKIIWGLNVVQVARIRVLGLLVKLDNGITRRD